MILAPAEWTALRLSLVVGVRAVALAAAPALLAGWLLSRPFRGRALLDAAVSLPMVLPPVVTGWLLLLVLGPHGPVGAPLARLLGWRIAFTTNGAAVAAATMITPLMARLLRLGFLALDADLLGAAASLGAGPVDRALNVAVPLLAPFLLAAVVTGFAASLGEFGAVITFAADIPGVTETLPIAIFAALQTPGGEGEAARLAAISASLAVIGLLGADWAGRRFARAAR